MMQRSDLLNAMICPGVLKMHVVLQIPNNVPQLRHERLSVGGAQ